MEGRLVEEGDVLRYGSYGAEACAEDGVASFRADIKLLRMVLVDEALPSGQLVAPAGRHRGTWERYGLHHSLDTRWHHQPGRLRDLCRQGVDLELLPVENVGTEIGQRRKMGEIGLLETEKTVSRPASSHTVAGKSRKTGPASRYLSKSQKTGDWMVVLAGAGQPVSAVKFPASRKKNREFLQNYSV